MAALKLSGAQVSTAPTASSPLPSYRDGHAHSTPVRGTDVPGQHSASARMKPPGALLEGWAQIHAPTPISWLNRKKTGAHLVEELGRLSALVLAQGPKKEGLHH